MGMSVEEEAEEKKSATAAWMWNNKAQSAVLIYYSPLLNVVLPFRRRFLCSKNLKTA
jgi:hypothetical protein